MTKNNGWTEERRKKQADFCQKNKPWQHATGPKTNLGKEISKNNALKHGLRSEDGVELRRLMHLHRLIVNDILKKGTP